MRHVNVLLNNAIEKEKDKKNEGMKYRTGMERGR